MPRLTIHLTTAQLAELTALHQALLRRRRETQGDDAQTPIEATATVAVEYGLQALRQVWVATEFGVEVHNAETLNEHIGVPACTWCGRSAAYLRAEDGKAECMRADCPRPPRAASKQHVEEVA